jgi:hypothetical protein
MVALMSGNNSGIWPGPGILFCIGSDDSSPKSPMTSVPQPTSKNPPSSSLVASVSFSTKGCSEAETTQTTPTPRLAETKLQCLTRCRLVPERPVASCGQQHQSSPIPHRLPACNPASLRLCVRYSSKVFPVSWFVWGFLIYWLNDWWFNLIIN